MKKVFENIFSIEYDDALRYDLDSLDVHNITEFKEYQGVNVLINAYLDRTKIPVSIDIGFGDVKKNDGNKDMRIMQKCMVLLYYGNHDSVEHVCVQNINHSLLIL